MLGDLGDLAHVALAGDADGHDRRGIEVELVDERRIHALRQLLDDRGNLVAHFLGRHVAVLFQQELHGDRREAFARGRAQLVDAGDLVDGFLDDLGDRGFHFLGAGAGQIGRDRDDGKIDLGEQVDAELEIGDQAEHDGNGGQHPGENGTADANVGDVHEPSLLTVAWGRGRGTRP